MLELRNIHVRYGAAPALWDVALQVQTGELVCVVGPNGAGKSTLINAIAGLNMQSHVPQSGRGTITHVDAAQVKHGRLLGGRSCR